MSLFKRKKIWISSHNATYDHPAEKISHIVCEIGCNKGKGFTRKDYTPQKNHLIDFLSPTLKKDEKARILEAAALPGETLKMAKLLKEIGISEYWSALSFSREVIPKKWYQSEKCFKKTIFFTVEYNEIEVDVRARGPQTIGGNGYIDGEELGDFIVAVPSHFALRTKYEYDPACCAKRPDETPEGQYRNAYQDAIDEAKKAAKKKFKKGIRTKKTGIRPPTSGE